MTSEYRTLKQIAATVRQSLKDELPGWKFSVRVVDSFYPGEIEVSLMSGPEQVVEARYNHVHNLPRTGATPEEYHFKAYYTEENPFPGYAQLNHYQLLKDDQSERGYHLSNGEYLTEKGWEVMRRATEILAREHWDKSDLSTDYFCCNFYMHVQIGQWNRDYVVKGGG